MKKKYNDNSKYFKDWTTKKLKYEAIGYDEMINVVECYGVRDTMAFIGIMNELDKRGIKSRLTFK